MYKLIPGQSTYSVSQILRFKKEVPGQECTLDPTECFIEGNMVTIPFPTGMCRLPINTLLTAALFEVELPEHDFRTYSKIKHVYVNPECYRNDLAVIPIFTKPFYVKGEYRIIPYRPRYATTIDGKVIEWRTGKVIKSTAYPDAYITIDLYNPVTGLIETEPLHRMVAFAWVDNDDWYNKTVVNHLDGNKHNPNANNLEWTTVLENNLHAIETGLRTDSIKVKLLDTTTGEVQEFPSLGSASAHMGLAPTTYNQYTAKLMLGKLVKQRWEMRVDGDDRPWYYKVGHAADIQNRVAKILTTVTFPDGSVETYNRVNDVVRRFKLWNLSSNIHKLAAVIEERYPGCKVKVEEKFNRFPVEAYELQTGRWIKAETMRGLARELGLSAATIPVSLMQPENVARCGYLFRYQIEGPWNLRVKEHKSKAQCIVATFVDTGKEVQFSSMSECAKHFGVDRAVISMRIRTGKLYKGWNFIEGSHMQG